MRYFTSASLIVACITPWRTNSAVKCADATQVSPSLQRKVKVGTQDSVETKTKRSHLQLLSGLKKSLKHGLYNTLCRVFKLWNLMHYLYIQCKWAIEFLKDNMGFKWQVYSLYPFTHAFNVTSLSSSVILTFSILWPQSCCCCFFLIMYRSLSYNSYTMGRRNRKPRKLMTQQWWWRI